MVPGIKEVKHISKMGGDGMDFPGGPVLKTPHFQCIPGQGVPCWGTKIQLAVWLSQKKKSMLKNNFSIN